MGENYAVNDEQSEEQLGESMGYILFNGWLSIRHEAQNRDLAYSFLV